MARKSVEVCCNGCTYRLRLTIEAQKKLQEYYKEQGNPSAFAVCLVGIEDPIVLCDVLDACLRWGGSGNPENYSGVELYEDLVDENQLIGRAGRAELIFKIITAAGIVDDKQAEKMLDSIRHQIDKALDELTEEETPEENPPTP